MNVKALDNGKTITKPLNDLIAEHQYLSDSTSWYICTLGKKLQKLEITNRQLKETIKSQGNECERRHNILCEIKEIIDGYFTFMESED